MNSWGVETLPSHNIWSHIPGWAGLSVQAAARREQCCWEMPSPSSEPQLETDLVQTPTHTHISHVCWSSWWKINKANAPRNNQHEAAKQILIQKQTEHKFKVSLHHPVLQTAFPQRRRRRNNLFISLHTSLQIHLHLRKCVWCVSVCLL